MHFDKEKEYKAYEPEGVALVAMEFTLCMINNKGAA
jgi:hypothetical protein